MDYSFLSSVMTVMMVIVFLAITVWAYDGRRRAQFEEASRLPFEDENGAHRESNLRQD